MWLGGLGVAGINFTDTAANAATLLAGPGARLALSDRDSSHQPFAAAAAEFAGRRPLAVASRTQISIHGPSLSSLVGQLALI